MPENKKKKKKDRDGQDRINRDRIEEDYGLSYALFKAFPELDDLLHKAVNNNWTPSKFQVELRQTNWFKNHSDIWREAKALKFSDPATFQERLGNAETRVESLAGAVGVDLSKKAKNVLSRRALLFGLDDDQLRDVLAKYVKPSHGHYGGDLSAVETELRQVAARNGVRLQKDQLNRWMKNIVRGDASTEQFVTSVRDMAARQFGLYGEQIKQGMDLQDVATPYIQSMASILELNPGQLDMFDPKIRKAMSGVRNKKGEVSAMSITDFEDFLRTDRRYAHTEQARNQATEYAIKLGEAFGVL